MAFWSTGETTPKRNFRWLVEMSDGKDISVLWWAKTVTTPSYEVSEVEHDFMDNKYYYPGRVTWNEISLTLVDPAGDPIDCVAQTLNILSASGYDIKDASGDGVFISKYNARDAVKGFKISVLDESGSRIEQWELKNPFIKSAKYGDLDYSNDDLRTVELSVRYDWATCEFPNYHHLAFDPEA
tara:strand:- start:166 stop:714 length:549 start_codon:yes stop_codon:yes gene_type:complete